MKNTLRVTPIRTEVFRVGQSLSEFLVKSLSSKSLTEGSILAITSKVISLSEGRLVPQSAESKENLIVAEADYDLGEMAFGCRLTIKNGLFIPSAGIDESCPLAIIENAPVTFCRENHPSEIQIDMEQDLYFPLYSHRLATKGRQN